MADNHCRSPSLRPPSPSPAIQATTRPTGLAHHRQPQPHRSAPPPIHPRPLIKIRPNHACQVRVQTGRGGLLRRTRQRIPQNPRCRLGRPPKFSAGKYTTYNYSDITWSQYGPYWRQAQKMCLTDLFSAKRLESYEYIRREELKAVLKELYDSSNKTIVLKDYLTNLSLNVISRMALGKKYLERGQNAIVSPEEFKKMLDELFLLNGVLNIGDFIPWIHFLDLQGYVKRMKALSKKFDRFMEHVLDEHKRDYRLRS